MSYCRVCDRLINESAEEQTERIAALESEVAALKARNENLKAWQESCRKDNRKHEDEAGKWDEQHAHQVAVNRRLLKKNDMLIARLAKVRKVLELIAWSGSDCPTAMTEAEFYRSQHSKHIGTAARALADLQRVDNAKDGEGGA